MPTSIRFKRYEITNAGGSVGIELDDAMQGYVFYGTANLSSGYTVTAATTPTTPVVVKIYYNGSVTLNSYNVTFFGSKLSQEQALSPCIIDAVYDIFANDWVVNILDNSDAGPPQYDGVETTTVPTGGGVLQLAPGKNKMWQQLVGSGSLTGSYSVTSVGDQPDGLLYFIKYAANITAGAYNISIFGQTLTSDEVLVGDTLVVACYDKPNLTWRVQHVLSAEYNFSTDIACLPVSFESGMQCKNRIYIPYNFKIVNVYSIVTHALAATNGGTITVAIDGGTSAGVITIPASSALDYESTLTPAANNVGSAGSYVDFTTAKANAGGSALVTIHIQRTA